MRAIRFMLLTLVLLQPKVGNATSYTIADFAVLRQRPSNADLRSANYSKTEWIVSDADGRLRIISRDKSFESADPLPFTYERDSDRAGNRHVVQVGDGWLVGFDVGEFGGGLWWFSEKGDHYLRIQPPESAPVHPNDIFRAANVRGFSRYREDLLVFMGLDHLSGRSGRIFRLVQDMGGWSLDLFSLLDGSPKAWAVSRERLLVLTGTGIWLVQSDGSSKNLHSLPLGSLYPNSMVLDTNGALHIGMRHYVLRLEEAGTTWRETWSVKSDCENATIKDLDCVCHP